PAPVLRARLARVTSFGVQGSSPLVDGVPAPAHYRQIAEAADAAGFDSLWASDHVAFHHPLLDVTVALSTFAAATERIRVGAGVMLLPLRPPALVAREFASLDYLSGGRVILGVGVGGEVPADFEAIGVPIRERGARTDASMRAVRELFPRQAPAPAQAGGAPLRGGSRRARRRVRRRRCAARRLPSRGRARSAARARRAPGRGCVRSRSLTSASSRSSSSAPGLGARCSSPTSAPR